ncbi:Zinc finger RING-type [Penicillium alfredii]|uniref:Zinc finger RING-type n=1 Tax=Penicillium alfredii TaxID=1506179 RepID=A0A9W9FSL3_9EURO|nr:Zinc finger RING-type [Penicillium alfredii]KAJ5105654.1 Zinc finger RING-type [Penicillium alfredii]
MSTYEIEHNTTDPSTATQPPRRRRPDLSTFFATLSEITPGPDHRPHAVPVPGDISTAFYSLAEALEVMRRDADAAPESEQAAGAGDGDDTGRDLLTRMIQSLLSEADTPPREVEGVSEDFCDMLDRVPKSSLKPSDICPICNNPFVEDPYPLVVQLPCHPTHRFDLECVRPWLRLRGTCPLDRFDFAKQLREKAEERKKLVEEDEEEEWDGMYG